MRTRHCNGFMRSPMRRLTASFSISSAWELSAAGSIRPRMKESNRPISQFAFCMAKRPRVSRPKFVAGKTDVLVCTTIIESGLDIPNANTIVIDRADQFGLADLYQLRGRVGRAEHKAYAYLLLPRSTRMCGLPSGPGKRVNKTTLSDRL